MEAARDHDPEATVVTVPEEAVPPGAASGDGPAAGARDPSAASDTAPSTGAAEQPRAARHA